jgi:acetyl esterase/lipase
MKNFLFIIAFIACIFDITQGFSQTSGEIENIYIENDLEFASYINSKGLSESLRLDLYQLKTCETNKRPVIIFVHGGGFSQGDKQQELYKKMAATFSGNGYVALSVNYTLMDPNTSYHRGVLDRDIDQILKVVRWLKNNKIKYKVDMSKVLLCGDSAGGGIVVNTSLNCKESFRFAGCIDLWGGMPGEKRWESPIYPYEISDCVPPLCIIHGSKDKVVPYKTSRKLASQLKAAKKYYELHSLKGAGHYPEELSEDFIPIMLSFSEKVILPR